MRQISEEVKLLKDYIELHKQTMFLKRIKLLLLSTDCMDEKTTRNIIDVIIMRIDKEIEKIG